MTQVLTRGRLDVDTTLDTDAGDNLTGWYCVTTDPWPCPNCGVVVNHMTAMHRIIVWPEQDDRYLLHHAQRAKEVGRNPKVREYERSMGEAISYYKLPEDDSIVVGRDVCGVRR